MKKRFTFTLLILTLASLIYSVKAIDYDYVVALDGSGDFTKIQDAINAVPSNQTDRRTVIFIKAGLYNTEKLFVPTDKINITIIGESRDQTIISYHIYDSPNCPETGNKCPAEDVALWPAEYLETSATLTIKGKGFRGENLTIENTAGPVGQAQALTIRADKCVFINCDITGYQDTLYFWQSGIRCYFEGCLILGRTDYIYGDGIAFFEACEIRSYGGGYITAPSTPQSQAYGFVFNNCDVTYTDGSPQPANDGQSFRLGRPWHDYPKVAWLNCDMTGMINPAGWGDKWNMDYADTSPDLHLYEYNNTGEGADMTNRAPWVGLRAITTEEAANYTVAAVLNGSDGWAPYEEPPAVTTYTWDNGGADNDWLTPENWNPDGTPSTAEVAIVEGNITIDANGGTFNADLNLLNGANLNISSSSTANYIAGEDATISSSTDVTLSGKLAVKDTVNLDVTSSSLTINADIIGIHKIIKKSAGTVILNNDNSGFTGLFIVSEGTMNAAVANSIGLGSVRVDNGATLEVNDDNAFFPESSLDVVIGATLNLNASITLSEFYIDEILQGVSVYDATTNPGLITGTGSVIVGRPSFFTFSSGTWAEVASYSPSLLPEAGELVYCEGEMETAPTPNPADVIFVQNKGKLRMRNAADVSTGTLTFEGGNRISYATGGIGFGLEAPIILNADINFEMSSGNVAGSTMKLTGSITGDVTIYVKNTRSDPANDSKVWLGGDNSYFSGAWDVTTPATNPNGVVGIVGASANAFGTGTILVDKGNYVQFDHVNCVSQDNSVTLASGTKAVVNADVVVGSLSLGGTAYTSGTFTATSNPDYIEGTGSITIEPNALYNTTTKSLNIYYSDGIIFFQKQVNKASVYSIDGELIKNISINSNKVNFNLPKGAYIVKADHYAASKILVID